MSDKDHLSQSTGQNLDELLRRSFGSGSELPADFESRVMFSIQQRRLRSSNGRRIFLTMIIYWSLASFASAWFLAGDLPVIMQVSNRMLAIMLPVVVTVVLCLVYLARQSRLRLSELFLHTIQ